MLAFKVADGKYFVDLVSKNVRKGEQPWRISTFGYPMGQGDIPLPMGHQDFATKFDAMKRAPESRGRIPAPGLLFSSPAETKEPKPILPRDYSQQDWDILIENLADSADSLTFARGTGRRNYELQDTATEFGEFARNRPTITISESLKLFRQGSSASTSKLAQKPLPPANPVS